MTSETLLWTPHVGETRCQVAIWNDPCVEELMPPAMEVSLDVDSPAPVKLSQHHIPS